MPTKSITTDHVGCRVLVTPTKEDCGSVTEIVILEFTPDGCYFKAEYVNKPPHLGRYVWHEVGEYFIAYVLFTPKRRGLLERPEATRALMSITTVAPFSRSVDCDRLMKMITLMDPQGKMNMGEVLQQLFGGKGSDLLRQFGNLRVRVNSLLGPSFRLISDNNKRSPVDNRCLWVERRQEA